MNPLLLPKGRPREGAGGAYIQRKHANAYALTGTNGLHHHLHGLRQFFQPTRKVIYIVSPMRAASRNAYPQGGSKTAPVSLGGNRAVHDAFPFVRHAIASRGMWRREWE